jgi:hypothetical protein
MLKLLLLLLLLLPPPLLLLLLLLLSGCLCCHRYRTTARIWNTATREIVKVIDLGPQAKVRCQLPKLLFQKPLFLAGSPRRQYSAGGRAMLSSHKHVVHASHTVVFYRMVQGLLGMQCV